MPLFPFAVLLAGSCEKQPQSTLSVPVDEAHSDDSDDIVIVSPSLRMKKTSTYFFNGLWSWIIWFTNKGISTEVKCIKDEQRRNISLQLSAFFQLWMNTCLICHLCRYMAKSCWLSVILSFVIQRESLGFKNTAPKRLNLWDRTWNWQIEMKAEKTWDIS